MTIKKWKYDFRDVSVGFKIFREWLLGRSYVFHSRFLPILAPRSIPPPSIPRGPEYKYANQYYTHRSTMDSVRPPVVAPVAEGPPLKFDPTTKPSAGGVKPDTICFINLPTPGHPWWWDGHFYYECAQPPCGKKPGDSPKVGEWPPPTTDLTKGRVPCDVCKKPG